MTKDPNERRTYRKSPGRQYEYEPLRSRPGRTGTSRPGERWAEENPSRGTHHSPSSSGVLAQRPDLRRTRQLLRQNILASKSKSAVYEDEDERLQEDEELSAYQERKQEERDRTLYGNRYLARGNRPSQSLQQHYPETDEAAPEEAWDDDELAYMDPDMEYGAQQYADMGYEDDIDPQLDFPAIPLERTPPARPAARRTPPGGYLPPAPSERRGASLPYSPEDETEYEEYAPVVQRRPRKRRVTRRKVLWGLGAAVVAGGAIAAVEYGPKVPQAVSSLGSDVERRIADAFNKGFNDGANAVRKDFINALEDMEGVSINAAMAAVKLMRTAYDVFVSPVVALAAKVTGDFLNATLRAFLTARHWLANIGQDNQTLGALQSVIELWARQVTQMPKQLQAITDADLDGANSYLQGVQRKINIEKAKLNAPNPTPAPSSGSQSQPKH
ncbi:MAG: hypothetical protein M3Z08_08435 [Chloroflexota bacterium]|nr:hypothetical protein [Chloroflexota bacterium]